VTVMLPWDAMKWTIRIELTPDGNEPITCDIATSTRSIADLSPEQIGLILEEGGEIDLQAFARGKLLPRAAIRCLILPPPTIRPPIRSAPAGILRCTL
jgi:hypothetical protein